MDTQFLLEFSLCNYQKNWCYLLLTSIIDEEEKFNTEESLKSSTIKLNFDKKYLQEELLLNLDKIKKDFMNCILKITVLKLNKLDDKIQLEPVSLFTIGINEVNEETDVINNRKIEKLVFSYLN